MVGKVRHGPSTLNLTLTLGVSPCLLAEVSKWSPGWCARSLQYYCLAPWKQLRKKHENVKPAKMSVHG